MHCRGLQKFKTAEGKVEKLRVGGRIVCVRVRWVDHKCKVNSDEFDEEENYLRVRQI
jgi:hypothetical protein